MRLVGNHDLTRDAHEHFSSLWHCALHALIQGDVRTRTPPTTDVVETTCLRAPLMPCSRKRTACSPCPQPRMLPLAGDLTAARHATARVWWIIQSFNRLISAPSAQEMDAGG